MAAEAITGLQMALVGLARVLIRKGLLDPQDIVAEMNEIERGVNRTNLADVQKEAALLAARNLRLCVVPGSNALSDEEILEILEGKTGPKLK